jgi:alcohol dehydrogenase (cytochrome c)
MRTGLTGALVVALAAPTAQAGSAVTWQDILADHRTTGDVVSYGLGPQGQRYSPLDRIDRANVADLVPAWAFSFGGGRQRGQEAQPLVHDGTIFVTASYSRVYAIDARSGRELWEYDHLLPDDLKVCCDVVNRGAALWGDLVLFATLDAQLVALDRVTGAVRWQERVDDYRAGYSQTAAPLIVRDLIVTGNAGGEWGVSGRVDARDAATGRLVWSRPVIEGFTGTLHGSPTTMTGELNRTWPGEVWRHGGGAPWNGSTYDPTIDLIYVGTGNPSPVNPYERAGDNLYTSSTLALDPATGGIVWHFQYTPHDGWDYDGVNEFVAFDYQEGGRTVQAGAHADRNGFFYVLDRTDGRFLRGFPFVSQVTWASGLDEQGRPVETGNRPADPAPNAGKSMNLIFTAPGFLGAKNWMPMAYSPASGLFYVPSNEWGMEYRYEPVAYEEGERYVGIDPTMKPLYPDHIGVLRAIDPVAGRIVWEHEERGPLWGGVLATGSGLVFTGTPEGFLKAFDAETGAELWRFQTGSGVIGSLITWEMDGRQYLAVVSGWGGGVGMWGGEVVNRFDNSNEGGTLWVFRLHP